MYKMMELLYAMLIVFQGYCLQYFLGSFLESRMKSRWNGLYVAALYVVLKISAMWVSPSGFEDPKVAVGTLALSLCILSFLALCFYKAFCPVTVFLIVSFQAVSDIGKYAAVILLEGIDGWVFDFINWCSGNGVLVSKKPLA